MRQFSNRTLLQSLLASVHEAQLTPDAPLIGDFDWEQEGVTQPFLVLFTGRCGSTWLTSLIRETGLVGAPEEFLNADVATQLAANDCSGLSSYFNDVVRRFTVRGRFGIQIDPTRLSELDGVIDVGQLFGNGRAAVFYMFRRDILAQAWSWASAKRSGKWHSREGETQRIAMPDPPVIEDIAREVIRLRQSEEYLLRFMRTNGMNAFPIEYESLVTETMGTLTGIFSWMGIPTADLLHGPTPSGLALNRLEYDTKPEKLAELWSACADVCQQLVCHRETIRSEEIIQGFKAAFGSGFRLPPSIAYRPWSFLSAAIKRLQN
jgi:LPS sulfotransferase NodH